MLKHMRECLPPHVNGLGIALGILSLAGLYGISRHNFLVFHCLTEAFTIVIAIAVCVIYWNTRQFLEYGAYLIIGLGCVCGGIFDLFYVFGYPGMSVFPGAGGNIALQAKTVAQWYVSASCVCAVPFLRRKINQNLALLAYGVSLALAIAAIFSWRIFPDCFIEGVGITPFARVGLLMSCGGYLATLFLMRRRRDEFDSYVFNLLVAALMAFFIQDLACATATDMNGFARTVAHLCQIVAIFFVYKAFVEIGLTRPYDLLFRTQQQSAEALRESEERYRRLFEAESDAVILAERQTGRIFDANAAALKLYGYSREEYLALQVSEISAEPDKTLQAIASGETHVPLRWHRKKDGTAFPVEIVGSYFDYQGRKMYVAAIRDITERIQAQEMLKQAHDEELQRQRAELAHVARLSMMGEMAVTLAHEVNQPLHAVKNYASGSLRRLRKRSEKDEELVAALGQISEEASRAAEIIRRVMGFVQKREPRFCEVSVNDLVEEVVLLGKAELEQHHTKIAFELSDALPAVIGDRIQIEQVLMNLLRNGLEALDETPEAKRLLVIKTLREGEDAVRVEVCDCGKGIGGEDLEKVFEPFFTTKPEGMGMGLAISRSIIQSHGGRLWGSANPVEGCTFHFTLPVRKTD